MLTEKDIEDAKELLKYEFEEVKLPRQVFSEYLYTIEELMRMNKVLLEAVVYTLEQFEDDNQEAWIAVEKLKTAIAQAEKK